MIIPSRVKLPDEMSSETARFEAGLDQYQAEVPPTPPFLPLLNTNPLSFLWIEVRGCAASLFHRRVETLPFAKRCRDL